MEFISQQKELGEKVLGSKYSGWRGLEEGNIKLYEYIWWRDLKLTCGGGNVSWFDTLIEWRVGDGKNTWFWEDRWCGGHA